MNMINDANMLLSIINMKLRDQYASLDELCDDLDLSKSEIEEKLKTIDYVYNEAMNQFR